MQIKAQASLARRAIRYKNFSCTPVAPGGKHRRPAAALTSAAQPTLKPRTAGNQGPETESRSEASRTRR